jgi:hypothetical protein
LRTGENVVGKPIEHLYDRGQPAEIVRPPEEDVSMARQLTLIDTTTPWRLDDQTREVGRRGLAEARAALAAHRPATSRPDAA